MRKIERFFAEKTIDEGEIISYFMAALFSEDQKLTLALDRTEWAFGQIWHNLLILSVLYKGTALSLITMPLERRSNSHTSQHIELIERLLKHIPASRIHALIGDREFIGQEWFKALKARHIPFAMRTRETMSVGIPSVGCCTIKELFETKKARYYKDVQIGTDHYDLSVKNIQDEKLAVISYALEKPLTDYKKRWGIETGFRCLKSSGFNLEDTHLREPQRIRTLVQLCSLAMAVSFRAFSEHSQKKHTNKTQKSWIPTKFLLHTSTTRFFNPYQYAYHSPFPS